MKMAGHWNLGYAVPPVRVTAFYCRYQIVHLARDPEAEAKMAVMNEVKQNRGKRGSQRTITFPHSVQRTA